MVALRLAVDGVGHLPGYYIGKERITDAAKVEVHSRNRGQALQPPRKVVRDLRSRGTG